MLHSFPYSYNTSHEGNYSYRFKFIYNVKMLIIELTQFPK